MNAEDISNNIIPNPLSSSSSFADLTKKGEILLEVNELSGVARNACIWLFIGVFLVMTVRFPIGAALIIFGTQMLVVIIGGIIRIGKVKALYSIQIAGDAASYKKVIIKTEYYELLIAIFGFIATVASIIVSYIIFIETINELAIQNITVSQDILKNIIFIYIGFSVIGTIVRVFRYMWTKNIGDSDVFRDYQIVQKKSEFVIALIGEMLIAYLLYTAKFPFIVLLFFIILSVIISIAYIATLNRLRNSKHDNINSKTPPSVVQPVSAANFDDKILFPIFGVTKVAVGFKDMFKLVGSSFLEVGKSTSSENSLIITNNRLLLVLIPVEGGDNILGPVNFAMQNVFFNRGELRKAGEEYIKNNSIENIIKTSRLNLPYNDIRKATLKQTQLTVEKNDGEKVSYLFLDREYNDILVETLQKKLGEKFVHSV